MISSCSLQKDAGQSLKPLQTQLSVGANSACGRHAADGVNHAIKWKIDLLCCHRDKLQYSLPVGPPEETARRVFSTKLRQQGRELILIVHSLHQLLRS